MNRPGRRRLTLCLPPLDGSTAAWLLDVCCHLQAALWRTYGEEINSFSVSVDHWNLAT